MVLYNANVELMQMHLPIAFKLFEDIHARLSAIDRTQTRFAQSESVRDTVHSILTRDRNAVGNVPDKVGRQAEDNRGPIH